MNNLRMTGRRLLFSGWLVLLLASFLTPALCLAWGFQAHQTINSTACDLTPPQARAFFLANRDPIVAHAGDPDQWAAKRPDGTRLDPAEPPRHFMDLDELAEPPFENIPFTYDEAARRFGRDRLNKVGTVPYRIQDLHRRMERAFKEKDWARVVRLAAWLGHYVADAHMPLHTTKNYDGKETGNDGIHRRFEVDMVDRFSEFQRLSASPALSVRHVKDVPDFVFAFTLASYRYIPKLFQADDIARKTDPNLADRYYQALRDASAGHIAMQRMTDAAHALASLWYTAWVDAGKPELPQGVVEMPADWTNLRE